VLGERNVHRLPNPIMGAEDFSYVLQRVPGTMMFLGGTPPDRDARDRCPPTTPTSSCSTRMRSTPSGVELYAQMALRHLGAHSTM
jgi:metal-dependent amidase/aminoacylase/carboxypeptidase family protein